MTHAKIIWLEWRDSSASLGWDSYERMEALPSTFTSGILIEDCEDHYSVAHSYDPDSDEFNGLIRIPREAVIRARTLCTIQMTTKKK